MAAVSGPLLTKSAPVESTLPPWMSVGCKDRCSASLQETRVARNLQYHGRIGCRSERHASRHWQMLRKQRGKRGRGTWRRTWLLKVGKVVRLKAST